MIITLMIKFYKWCLSCYFLLVVNLKRFVRIFDSRTPLICINYNIREFFPICFFLVAEFYSTHHYSTSPIPLVHYSNFALFESWWIIFYFKYMICAVTNPCPKWFLYVSNNTFLKVKSPQKQKLLLELLRRKGYKLLNNMYNFPLAATSKAASV